MDLSDKSLKQFEILWQKHNPGQQISQEELHRIAMKLLRIVSLVYGSSADDFKGMRF